MALSQLRTLVQSIKFVSIVSGVAVALIHLLVFPLGSMNADELAYQNMATAFMNGNTKIPIDPVLGQGSVPWLMANVGNWSVAKYQPLYPLFLTSSSLLGSWLPLAALASATTYTVGKLAEAFSASGIRAAWLWAGSSSFIISASTLLPYVFSLELGLLMLLVASKSNQHVAVKLGGLFALAILCRPMDAVLFAGTALVILWQRKEFKNPIGLVKYGLACASAFLPALLWNWIQTGNPLEFPFTLTSSSDTWGFGVRKIYDSSSGFDFTVWNGVESIINNLGRVLVWTFGGIALIPLAYMTLRKGSIKYRLSLGALVASWIIAYGGFWGSYTAIRFWNGPDFIGPFYWLPISLVIVLLISAAPRDAFDWKPFWITSALLASVVFGSVLAKNWRMTDSWVKSDLVEISKDPNSVIKLDRSYTSHIGSPIPLIDNEPSSKKFSLDWNGVLGIIEENGLQTPTIWIAIASEQTRFNYLPRLTQVAVSSSPAVMRFSDIEELQVQVTSSSDCAFKSVSARDMLEIDFSTIVNDDSFTGTCSERSEDNELVIQLMRISDGTLFRKIYSFYDPLTRQYFSAIH